MTLRRPGPAFWATAGFVLVQLAWLLVLPPYAGMDEVDHSFRASSVAAGHWQAGGRVVEPELARGPLVPVRADVAEAARPACDRLPYVGPLNCRPARDLPGDEVEIATGAAAYNPLYYALVGIPADPFQGNGFSVALRVVNAAVCAFLFWLACRAALVGTRSRWPLVGVVVAALPTTMHATAVAAPNGIEMVSGLAFWSVALALLRAPHERSWLYPAAALSGATLAVMHTLGSVWLALILLGIALYAGVRPVLAAALPRARGEVLAFAFAVALVLAEIAWVVLSRTNDTGPATKAPGESAWSEIPTQSIFWVLQAIAVFPFRNERAPTFVYLVTFAVVGALAAAAWLRGRRRERLALGYLVLVSFAVPIALTVLTYASLGLSWQGRYGMPFTAGFLVLLGLVLDRAGVRPLPVAGAVAGAAAWALVQVGGHGEVRGDFLRQQAFLDAVGWDEPPLLLLVAVAVATAACWSHALLARERTPA